MTCETFCDFLFGNQKNIFKQDGKNVM